MNWPVARTEGAFLGDRRAARREDQWHAVAGEVGDDRFGADLARGAFERLLGAGADGDPGALAGERCGAGATEPLARPADQGDLAGKLEVHRLTPSATPRGRAGPEALRRPARLLV
jgi:hypothetical protein